TPPRQLQRNLDRDLETICLRCLEKEPRRRYPSAEALADDLERWRRGEPIHARPINSLERTLKWARRRPAIAGLLAELLLVTVLGCAGITWKYLDAEPHRLKAEGLAEEFRNQTVISDQRKTAAETAEQKAKDEAGRATAEEARARRQLDRAEGLLY